MTNRYERIRKARQALESLRERCAQEAERITGRRRVVASMVSSQAVKPCEVATAIRKIDVQQHYECAAREIERMRTEIEALRKLLDRMVVCNPDGSVGIRVTEDALNAAAELYRLFGDAKKETGND